MNFSLANKQNFLSLLKHLTQNEKQTSFIWAPGNSGIHGNKAADKAARNAADLVKVNSHIITCCIQKPLHRCLCIIILRGNPFLRQSIIQRTKVASSSWDKIEGGRWEVLTNVLLNLNCRVALSIRYFLHTSYLGKPLSTSSIAFCDAVRCSF